MMELEKLESKNKLRKITLIHLEGRAFFQSSPPHHVYPLAEFLVDVFGQSDFNTFRNFVYDSKVVGSGTNMAELEKEADIIIITSLYGDEGTEVRIPKIKFLKLLDYLDENAHLAKDNNLKKLIFVFDDDWNCNIIPEYEE